ncbi:MAG TPA: MogA/MoaB family molybdenum cofactor biosynthesis protein [Tepidisphaeraceae bacterium]|jgi:molybdenum cofactor biosynthesis protein B
MAYDQHVASARDISARCAVVTLSDTRTPENDTSGQRIQQLLADAGHHVTHYSLIREDPPAFATLLDRLLEDSNVEAILTNGGTGVSKRDATIPIIEQKIQSLLPGFGELFRMLSWEQIGSGALLSRATAGIGAGGKPLFALPGSTKAVELAMTKLILPELRHILWELKK